MPVCHLISSSPNAPVMSTVTPQKSKLSSSLNDDFPSMISLDESLAAVVSPSPSYASLASPSRHGDSSSSTTSSHSDEIEDFVVNPIVKTAHKLLEERGFAMAEPLLTENPNRFVLFPIQDDDVRSKILDPVVNTSIYCSSCLTISLTFLSDLANVQKSRSLVLDRRRD
jgi:hypothetical protein